MSCSAIVSSAGIVLDIIGVVMVFTGLPPLTDEDEDKRGVLHVSRSKGILEQESVRTPAKQSRRRRAKAGLSIILAGFVLQILGQWI